MSLQPPTSFLISLCILFSCAFPAFAAGGSDPANAGADQQICSDSVYLQGNTPAIGEGAWSLISGNAVFEDASDPATLATGLPEGETILVWEFFENEILQSSDTVIITRFAPPSLSAGDDQLVCSDSTRLDATLSEGTGTWQLIEGSATIDDVNNPQSDLLDMQEGQLVLVWSVPAGVCPAQTDTMMIQRSEPPVISAGPDQSFCGDSTGLQGSLDVGIGEWNILSGNGDVLQDNIPNSGVVFFDGDETMEIEWRVTWPGCPDQLDTVLITSFISPEISAGDGDVVCSDSSQLAASLSSGTGTWTVITGLATVEEVNNPNSNLLDMQPGQIQVQWSVVNGVCPAVLDTVDFMRTEPAIINAGNDTTFCGDTLRLNASISDGFGNWNTIAGDGFAENATDPQSLAIFNTGETELQLEWNSSVPGCPLSRDTIVLTSIPNPVISAGNDTSLCSDEFNLSAEISLGIGSWTIISGSANISEISNPTSAVTNAEQGEIEFVWSASNGACPSVSDTVLYEILDTPVVNAGEDQLICDTLTNLEGTSNVSGASWILLSGDAEIGDDSDLSSAFTIAYGEIAEVQLLASVAGCPDASDTVLITSLTPPVINAGEDQSICGTSAQLDASLSAGNGQWTIISGSGTIEDDTDPQSNISAQADQTLVLEWLVTLSGCEPVRDTVEISFLSVPTASAGADQEICGSETQLEASGTGTWTFLQGTGILDNANDPTTLISSLSEGTVSLIWTVSSPGCPEVSDTVEIVTTTPPVINAGEDQSICGTSAQLDASLSAGNGQWTIISGFGTIEDDTDPQSNISAQAGQTLVLEWLVTLSGCEPVRDTVEISFLSVPTASAGADQEVCGSETQLEASGSGTWTFLQGTGILENANDPTSLINSLSEGTVALIWTVSSPGCPDAADTVNIVSEIPAIAEAGTDQEICSSSATLSATPAAGGFWEIVSGSGVILSASSASTTVSGLSAGTTTIRWAVPNSICPESSDTLQIVVNEAPVQANAGEDQSICSTTTTLDATPANVGSGQWTIVSGNAVFTNANSPVTTVSALQIGANVLRWTVSNGNCPSSFDEVTINVDSNPETAEAGDNQEVCASSATLGATPPGSGTGTWSLVSGDAVIVSPNSASSQVLSLAEGENVFRWTISGGSCGNVFDDVVITRYALPDIANAGTDQSICASATTLAANTPTTGIGTWSVLSGTAVFNDANNPLTSVSGLSQGVNVFEWSISNGNCPPSANEVTITVDQQVDAPDAGEDQSVCSSSATLSALSGTGGTWSLVSGSGTIATPGNTTTSVSGLGTGQNIFRWTVSGGSCGTASDDVTITRFALPTTSNAGTDQSICSSSATLAANTPSTGFGTWSVVSGSAIFNDENNPLTSVSGLSQGANVLRWSISNGVCPASTDEVTITVDQQVDAPDAGEDQSVCSSTATLAALSGTNGMWSLVSGSGTIATPGSASTSVTGLSAGVNVFRWTVSGGSCGTASDDVSITRFALPTTANAGTDQSICSSSATLAANTPSTGVGTWSVVSGSAVFNDENNPLTSVSGLSQGANVLRWSISNGNCPPSADEATITVDQQVDAPDAGEDQSVCSSTATLAAVSGTGGIWSLVSGSGTIATPGNASTTVTGLSAGVNVFRWTVSGGSCGTASDDVNITRFALPTTANAGTDQSICSSSATLAANTPSTGVGTWSVISGSAIFNDENNPVTSVSGLSQGANVLRWSISNGVCPASTDEVTITVDQQAEAPDAGPNQDVCSSTVTLTAVSGTGGTWSLVSGSGNIATPGNASTTVTGLSTGANVFRWTVSGGSCGSASDEVTVTRFGLPTNASAGSDQNICATSSILAANTPVVGSGLWSVVSGSAVFNDESDPLTQISGLSGGENILQWTISNGACPSSTDQLSITVELPADPPNAGSDQTICGTSATLTALSGTGGTWSLVSGSGTIASPGSATSSVSGLATGTNVFRWTVSGGACGNAFDEVSIVVQAPPSISNAGSDQSVCGSSATLSANVPTIGTGTWIILSGAGSIADPGSAVTTVSGLSGGQNVFRWLISNGVCTPSADEVTITAQLDVPDANAGSDQSVCSSATTLAAEAATGGFWTVVSGTGQLSNSTLFNSGVTGMSAGLNVFRWNVPAGACGTITDDVQVTVQTLPTLASAGSDQNICSTIASLQANSPLIGAGLWSVVQGSGIFSNASDPFTSVSGLQAGTNVLRWTISNGVCPPSADDVVIIVDSNPVTPSAGADQQVCASSATLSASPTGGTWSVVTGSAVFGNVNSATTSVSGLSAGQNRLRWTVGAGACGTVFDDVIITVSVPPSTAFAGADQEICATFTSLSAVVPLSGTGQWTVVSGSGVFENATSAITTVSGLSAGINTFRWTVSSGACPPSADDITVTVQENPLSPEAGPNQTICASSTQLAATPFPGGMWSLVSGAGTVVTPSSASSSVTGLGAGANVFRWTIPGGACDDVSDQVTITVQASPTISNAGTDQQICATVTELAGNTPMVGTGTWTVVSGSGTFSNANSASTTVSGLSTGTNIFRWTITNGVCPPSADNVTVSVDNNPLSPEAGPNQTICATSTQLAATAAPGGQWTLVSGSGTIASATQANTIVTALGTGANVFRWTIPGGTCGSVSDQVTITVDAPPTTATAGSNQTICVTSNGVSLAANQPNTGSGLWSVVSGSGSFTNTADPTAFVSGLSTGNNVFQWTISNGVCPSSSAQVVIQVDPLAIPPNAGSDQTICSAGTQLSATPAAGAVWSLVSGTATITNTTLASSTVSGLSPGTVVLQWSVPGGACPGASDQMSITVQAPPTAASAGADQEICSTTANLQANTPVTGTGFWTVVSGSGVFADPTAASTQVSGLSPGNNTFRWSISNGVCAPSSDDVTVVVQDNPVSPSAGSDQTICTNSTQLNATADPDGSWSLVSGSGTIVNSALANTTVNGLGTGTNVFRWTISGGSCPDASDDVVITVQQAPTAANAGQDQTICLEGTQLAANIPVTGTGTWSLVSGSGTFADAQLAATTVSGLSAGTNTFRWTISNGVCPQSSDDVNIVVQELGTAPNAGPDQVICGSTAIMAASPSGGTWSLVSGSGTFQNSQSATTSISGLSTGSNVFRWTVQNGVCPALSDDVTILVQTAPSTAAAGPDQSVCSSSTSLAANVPLSGNGLWTVVSGTGFFSNATQATSNVSGMSPGLNVFRWTISNGNCPPSFDEISVTVLSAPSAFAGQDQNICGSSTVMAASAPQAGVGTWTVISGSANFSDAQSASSAVGGLSTGINVLRWTVVNGSCPPAFDEVTIQSFAAPEQPDAGSDQSICSATAQLSASEPVNGQGIWSVVSGAGLIADPESASTSVSNLQSGINVFRFTVSNGICATVSDEVSIELLSQPAANAGADQSVCAGSATLNASLASGASGQWQLISGSAVIQNTSSPGTLVSNLGVGQNIFQWTVSNGTCPPQQDQVIVTRFEEPSVANAGADFQTCATGATLSANVPTVGSGFWSVVSGNGNFSNPTNPNTAVSQLAIGDNVLQWTISNGSCPPQSDQVIVTVDQNPTSADAGPDQGICSDITNMAATAPVAGDGEWTVISGTASITSPADPNTGITAISAGTATLRWTVTNGSCVSFDDVEITRYLPPTEADAGVDRQLCSDTVHLHANIPTIGDGFWSVVSGTATIQNPSSPNAVVTSLSAGANVFVWTISNGSCTSSTDQVTVIRQEAPDAANAGPDQQVCDTEAILAANLPQVGTGIWSVVSGNGEIDDAFSPTASVTNLSAGENIFRWTTLNGICPASTDQLSIFRAPPPSPAVAGSDAEICGNTASLDAETPETGAGTWSVISGTAVIADENDPQTGLNNILPGTITLVWQVSNSPCQAETDTVQLFAATQPPQAFAGSNIQTCETSVLLVGSSTGGGTPNWQLISGSATISNSNGQITSVTDLEPGQNQLEYSVSNAHCVSRDTILITRFVSEPFVYAGPDSIICSNEIVLQGSEAEFGNGVWTLLSGSAVLSNPNTESATLNFITDTVQLSWTVSNGVCPAVADTVLLIMTQPEEVALAMDDGTFCANLIQISATPAIEGSAWWNLISGDAVIDDTTQAITTVTPQDFGEIVLEWILVDGSCRTADTVTITANEAPYPVDAGEDQLLCGTNTILDATEPELGAGIWSTLAGGFFSDATDPKSGFITPNSGYRALVWNVTLGPCTLRDTVYIDMIEVPIANAGPDLIGCGGDTLALQAENPSFGDGLWTSLSAGAIVLEPDFHNSDFIAENPGNYYLIWKVSNDICADSSILTITILESDDPSCIGTSDEVFIPEGFSPNGDGVFDQFVIGHNPDKKVELQVYDRRGALIYKSEDYQNDWDGSSVEGTILIDGKLPEGTYFYLIKVEGDYEFRKGYFTLWR